MARVGVVARDEDPASGAARRRRREGGPRRDRGPAADGRRCSRRSRDTPTRAGSGRRRSARRGGRGGTRGRRDAGQPSPGARHRGAGSRSAKRAPGGRCSSRSEGDTPATGRRASPGLIATASTRWTSTRRYPAMVATPVAERPWEPTGPRGEICGTTRGVAPKHVSSTASARRAPARPPGATSHGRSGARDPGWQNR